MDVRFQMCNQRTRQTINKGYSCLFIIFCRWTKETSTLWSHQGAGDFILWWTPVCVCVTSIYYVPLSSSAGSKSKGLTPQWDIMAKRVSEASRPSVSLQDEVHELDWPLCGNNLYYKTPVRWDTLLCLSKRWSLFMHNLCPNGSLLIHHFSHLCQTFDGSSFLNVRISAFLFSFMIVNEESLFILSN